MSNYKPFEGVKDKNETSNDTTIPSDYHYKWKKMNHPIEDFLKAEKEITSGFWKLLTDEALRFCEPLHQELSQCKKELTKYKRAFEILKDKGIVEIEKYTNIGSVIYKAYGYERYLEQEEAELLEELINNES